MDDSVDSLLGELERRLRSAGIVVVAYRNRLEIRLPLFASVRVSIVDGQLACEPRFGFVPRDRSTWATLMGVASVTAALLLTQGITPLSLMLGFVGVSSTAGTAIRYQLTESAITRVQTAWMLMTAGSSSSGVSLGELTRAKPELGPATQGFRPPTASGSTPLPRQRKGS